MFARDTGSGLGSIDPSLPLAPASVAASTWTPVDNLGGTPVTGSRAAQLRTYAVSDLAGNRSVLVLKVRPPDPTDPQLKQRLMTIQYGASTPIALAANLLEVAWRPAATGSPATMEQVARTRLGASRQVVTARYVSQRGSTRIVVENPQPQPAILKPGLDLLQMTAASGRVSIQY